MDEPSDAPEVLATPLTKPFGGTPEIISTSSGLESALAQLSQGSGAFAVDAERASGYKYFPRAYLIQIKRTGGGLHLIDPVAFSHPHPLFAKINELLGSDEVILHASTQDLPCLREVGLHPTRLFDTELGGRIAGFARVGLGPLVEGLLGFSLAKEHSAVDWSTRPLPKEWLAYAALDVELLIELREKIAESLIAQGKLEWASEEFASILADTPNPARIDPWRRTSGIHKIKRRDHLASIQALWCARDEIARERDIAPGKLLNDAALVEIAVHAPTNSKEIEKVLRPIGLRARWLENADLWLRSIISALALDPKQWPTLRAASDGLPPVKIWRDKYPIKFAHLSHARASIDAKAQELSLPTENLISPEYVRRICWNCPDNLQQALEALGARAWQIEITAPLLALALLETQPLILTPEEAPDPEEL